MRTCNRVLQVVQQSNLEYPHLEILLHCIISTIGDSLLHYIGDSKALTHYPKALPLQCFYIYSAGKVKGAGVCVCGGDGEGGWGSPVKVLEAGLDQHSALTHPLRQTGHHARQSLLLTGRDRLAVYSTSPRQCVGLMLKKH